MEVVYFDSLDEMGATPPADGTYVAYVFAESGERVREEYYAKHCLVRWAVKTKRYRVGDLEYDVWERYGVPQGPGGAPGAPVFAGRTVINRGWLGPAEVVWELDESGTLLWWAVREADKFGRPLISVSSLFEDNGIPYLSIARDGKEVVELDVFGNVIDDY